LEEIEPEKEKCDAAEKGKGGDGRQNMKAISINWKKI